MDITSLDPAWVTNALKVIGVAVLLLYLPLIALSYYAFRRPRRHAEIQRVRIKLGLDSELANPTYLDHSFYLFIAVFYASMVSAVGLGLLMFADALGLSELPTIALAEDAAGSLAYVFPRPGSRLVFAMAFLGGYLWGMQHLLARYSQNDLMPVVYYQLATRMLLAGVVALAIYNGYSALIGASDQAVGMNAWPVIALLIGMFPQRGLMWLTERIPFLAAGNDTSVVPAPLDMIQGVQAEDIIRLGELGIHDCYNLAQHDFIPLVLHTPYGARELLDWILQAKLCALFPDAMVELRENGVRTVSDLEGLSDEETETLATNTKLTARALARACAAVRKDDEVKRLREAALVLGQYWEKITPALAATRPSTRAAGTAPKG